MRVCASWPGEVISLTYERTLWDGRTSRVPSNQAAGHA